MNKSQHIQTIITKYRDVIITAAAIAASILILFKLPKSFGLNIGFTVPLISVFYKLLSILGLSFAFILIIVNNKTKKHITYNLSLLIFYVFSSIVLFSLIIALIYHFEISINDVFGYFKSKYNFKPLSIVFFYMIFITQIAVFIMFLLTIIYRTKRIASSILTKIDAEHFDTLIVDYIYGNDIQKSRKVEEISAFIKDKNSRKKMLINTLLIYNNNFRGDLRQETCNLYFKLNLNKFVNRILYTSNVSKTTWAINVSSSFGDTTTIDFLKNTTATTQDTYLRVASAIALIRLGETELVIKDLLDNKEKISELDVLKLVSAFRSSPKVDLDFTPLLKSNSDAIIILGLNLVNEFNRIHNIEDVKELLVYPKLKVVQVAIRTLNSLNPGLYENNIVEILPSAPNENKVEMLHSIASRFSRSSFVWSCELLQTEESLDIKLIIIAMMKSVLKKNDELLSMFDESQKDEIRFLIEQSQNVLKQ